MQCRVGGARGAVLLAVPDGSEETARVIAGYPPAGPGADRSWVRRASEQARELDPRGRSSVLPVNRDGPPPLYGEPPGPQIVMMAAGTDEEGGLRAEAFLVEPRDDRDLAHRRQLLELSRSLLDLHALQHEVGREMAQSRRLALVLDVQDAFQSAPGFRGAAMALCNEVCSRFRAERVSLGLLRGRYVRLAAMSHTEHLKRRMQAVQDIEAAMEECLDQDLEVFSPAPPETPVVSRAGAELAKKHGPSAVLSLPLRNGEGKTEAVLTLERSSHMPFGDEEIRALRLLGNLTAPRLLELSRSDRWFGARWASQACRVAAKAVGAEHTWVKLAAMGLLAAAIFLVFGQGTDWVESSFVVEPVVQRSVPAPWDGYLADVVVEPGDVVTAGETVLARLDTAELRMELARARADRQRYLTEADLAWRDGKQAERQVALAQAEQAEAEVELLEHRLDRASLTAPISGVVIEGDLRKQMGRPVEKGQELFTIAPLDALRAVMMVPEDRIFDVREGQTGELATASHPGEKMPFVVEQVYPVAEVVDKQNVFKARLRLEGSAEEFFLKPGVEGVAKADAGRASFGWLWTRDAVNWVRMKLWW
ncbi:MAG: efflux RND transporter periplasmic adaptor subunit [Phycisphaeraceae bacterium]